MKNKIYINAPITLGFVGICFIVYLLGELTSGASTRLLFSTYHASLFDPLTYVRLFGHVLGHADFQHFLSNMTYVLLLGPILEEKYQKKMIGVFLVTALITGIFHNLFGGEVMLLGASGIVFAMILLSSITGTQDGIPLTLILVALFWIGGEVITSITKKDTISQLTHIIGGISGAFMGLSFKKK